MPRVKSVARFHEQPGPGLEFPLTCSAEATQPLPTGPEAECVVWSPKDIPELGFMLQQVYLEPSVEDKLGRKGDSHLPIWLHKHHLLSCR